MILVLIRHAPTVSNLGGVFMGQMDIECEPSVTSELAQTRPEWAIQLHPKTVYSSPLKRATETARALFGQTVPLMIDERLVERGLGTWEGCSRSVLEVRHPEGFLQGSIDPRFNPPGGESSDEVIKRAADFILERWRASAHDGEDKFVVVTHNGLIKAIRYLVQGISLEVAFIAVEPHLQPIELIVKRDSMSRILSHANRT